MTKIGQFNLAEDIRASQIKQLFGFSQTDPQVANYTSDRKRFQDIDSYNLWYQKSEKNIYVLEDQDRNLKGLIWIEEKQLRSLSAEIKAEIDINELRTTIGMRLYEEARGKGLAKQFMKKCLDLFFVSDLCMKIGNQKVWLIVSDDNTPALRTYNANKFKTIGKIKNSNKLIMSR